MTRCCAPGASTGTKLREGGEAKPQGAENSALKNRAPFIATPPRISENASISFLDSRQKPPDSLQSDLRPLDSESIPPDARAWCPRSMPRTIRVATGDREHKPP